MYSSVQFMHNGGMSKNPHHCYPSFRLSLMKNLARGKKKKKKNDIKTSRIILITINYKQVCKKNKNDSAYFFKKGNR